MGVGIGGGGGALGGTLIHNTQRFSDDRTARGRRIL